MLGLLHVVELAANAENILDGAVHAESTPTAEGLNEIEL
jgi:hypothetical protein